MKTERVHTLILGAGPSGLAAGYTLAKAGRQPVVLERDKVSGGLMRSLRRGDFILDIGRKELYNRLARVDEFWADLLGSDYRVYTHRGGILYEGHIIDMSPEYQGLRRGMLWRMLLGSGLDFLWWRTKSVLRKPRNLEEYWYRQRGRMLTRIANQGFQEKLVGRKWADVPLPESLNGHGESFLRTASQALKRFVTSGETNTYKGVWKHPAQGTGRICDALEQNILKTGGRVHHEAKVMEMCVSQGIINRVIVELGAEHVAFEPAHVVSSAPAEFLQQLLLKPSSETAASGRKP